MCIRDSYFLDLDSGQAVAHTQIRFFGLGCQLPDEPQASHAFEHPRLQLRFDEQPGRLRVTGQAPDLGGLPLELALEVRRPSHLESVNLVVPCLLYTSVLHAMPSARRVSTGWLIAVPASNDRA